MWIIYLLLTLVALPILVIAGMYLFALSVRRREISLAGKIQYSDSDPLLSELDPNQTALLYFTSDNCAPCKTVQEPAIEALKQQMPNLTVIMVNTIEQPEVAKRWKVMSLPRTFIIGKNRRVHVTNMDVAHTAMLKAQLEAAMQSSPNSVTVNVPSDKQGFRLPRIKFKPSSNNP